MLTATHAHIARLTRLCAPAMAGKDRKTIEKNYPGAEVDEGGRFKPLPPADDDAKLLVCEYPSLGVIRLDYDYPPALGDIDHPGSFYYDVFYRVVPGLTFGMCQKGEMPDEIKQRFIDAIKWLDAQGVAGITSDCGFFMNFQDLARTVTDKPVFMSSLCQLPAVVCAYAAHEHIALFTANGESLKPMRDLIKKECGVDPEESRFIRLPRRAWLRGGGEWRSRRRRLCHAAHRPTRKGDSRQIRRHGKANSRHPV